MKTLGDLKKMVENLTQAESEEQMRLLNEKMAEMPWEFFGPLNPWDAYYYLRVSMPKKIEKN